MKRIFIIIGLGVAAVLVAGSARNPNFWATPTQRGDALVREQRFADAAKVYQDPWRIGIAQYRNGDFEAAAKTFARVPGATGAFDQGNAWLMHGAYGAAIASYDRALGLRPDWKEAEENKALAAARKAKIDAAGGNREQEQTGQDKPDEIRFDQKGNDQRAQPAELAGQEQPSDAELRATWLRRVQTTPADFLRAKFASQVAQNNAGKPPEEAK